MDTGSSPCFASLAASSQTSVVTQCSVSGILSSLWGPQTLQGGAPRPLCSATPLLQGPFALTWLVRLSLRQSSSLAASDHSVTVKERE